MAYNDIHLKNNSNVEPREKKIVFNLFVLLFIQNNFN